MVDQIGSIHCPLIGPLRLSSFMDPSPVFSRLHLHTAGTRKTAEEGKDNRWPSGLPDGPLLLSSSIVANPNRFDLLSLGCICEPEALGAHLSVVIVHPRPRSWMLTPFNPQSCAANSSFVFLLFFSLFFRYFCTTHTCDSSCMIHTLWFGAAPTVMLSKLDAIDIIYLNKM